jgi:tetratricopeptide (TPR) repeat protein
MKHLLWVFLAIYLPLTAQQTAIDLDLQKTYKMGQDFFEQSLYGPGRWQQSQYIHLVHPASEDDFANLKDDAAAMYAISGLRADMMSGENEVVTFIHDKYPDPVTTPAILELGSYYYNKKWYKKCIETYDMVDLQSLSEYDMSEAALKKGYAHFVSKEFDDAKKVFALSKDKQNEFYYPTNYYYGMCEYFTNNYKAAINYFDKVKNNSVYKSYVPYYLTQIYFSQNQYDEVISYGEQSLKDPELRNRKEIRQLLGQSYFNKNQYEKALPHLEYYEATQIS